MKQHTDLQTKRTLFSVFSSAVVIDWIVMAACVFVAAVVLFMSKGAGASVKSAPGVIEALSPSPQHQLYLTRFLDGTRCVTTTYFDDLEMACDWGQR